MTRPSISTHVLDTRLGRPAAGVAVSLYRLEGAGPRLVGTLTTDAEGRIGDLVAGTLRPGPYRIAFELADYFRAQGERALFSRVVYDIEVADPDSHYHIPLLASPYACVSYRGS